MVRINLLPAYVAQRRLTARLRVVFAALFIVIVVGLVGWYVSLVPQVSKMKQQADAAVDAKQTIDTLNNQATSTLAQIAPITAKVDFVNKVAAYNVHAPQLYERIARWTSPSIFYTDMAIQGDGLDIKGYTRSIADLGRYLQYMYTEPDIDSVSLTSSLPNFTSANEQILLYKGHPVDEGNGQTPGYGGGMGYRTPQFSQFPPANSKDYTIAFRHVDSFGFEVQCHLTKPLEPPSPPSAGGAGGAAGAAGAAGPAGALGGAPGMGGPRQSAE